jgi:Ser/Thr protein kinase RdoA (MazF antagonist)
VQPPEADSRPFARVLDCYPQLADPTVAIEPLGRGLINQTYRACTAEGQFVLQRVSAIFDPAIHHNIRAVTRRLRELGLCTPELLDSRDGTPWVDLGPDGVWRLSTLVEGVGFDVVQSLEQARAAGRLVASFHRALEGLDHHFVGVRLGVHDTGAHLGSLRQALEGERSHRLRGEVLELGSAILEASAELPPLPLVAPRPCHGDLKLNNLLFAGPSAPERDRALCLIDLDTLGPMELGVELGDAWRSWCNPGGENRTDASFDLAIFEASWQGYAEASGRALPDDERRALLLGVEWVSLELSARFAADALRERYFGWDPERFPRRGEHNLIRARSQWAVHRAAVAARASRAELLGVRLP